MRAGIQHEIRNPLVRGIFFLFFGFMFITFAVLFAVVFIRQSESVMPIILIESLFGFAIYGFIAMGIKNLKIAAHPESEEQEQEEEKQGSRTTGIVFLFIGLWSGVLTVWALPVLLHTSPAVAVFCMAFTALFLFFGIYMYKNKLVSLSFSLGDIKLNVKKKKITADVANRSALVHKCIIIIVFSGSFFVMGTCLTIFGLWPFLAMVIIGSIFLIPTVRVLYYSRRKDFKIIYTVPEPEPQSKQNSKPTKTQTDSTLQSDSVHSIPYTAKPGKESVFNNQRVLEAEAEMERLKAKEEQRKQRSKAREERRQAQSEEYRQQVQARRERIANALAKKKSVFFIVAGLLLLVPFLVCLWCDFQLYEVLRSGNTTIFWYDDSVGRLFSHVFLWLPAFILGCHLLFLGLRRKHKLKNTETPPTTDDSSQLVPTTENGHCDDLAVVDPNRATTSGGTSIGARLKAAKARRPKLFKTLVWVSIVLIPMLIGFLIGVLLLSIDWAR